MSGESQFDNLGRSLRPEEAALIRALLSGIYPPQTLESSLRSSRVSDMQDGGMGSIRFLGSKSKTYGTVLVEAEYVDSDGVPVSITVNADKQGQLFELDFWKVNFARLKRYPNPSDVSTRRSV
jgi:hypothetical protein